MQLLIYALFDDDIDWIQFFANFLSSNNLKSFFWWIERYWEYHNTKCEAQFKKLGISLVSFGNLPVYFLIVLIAFRVILVFFLQTTCFVDWTHPYSLHNPTVIILTTLSNSNSGLDTEYRLAHQNKKLFRLNYYYYYNALGTLSQSHTHIKS